MQYALEIRSYLHNRALMQYGDRLEASEKCHPELLNLNSGDPYSQFGMKRGHVTHFVDRTAPCNEPLPKSYNVLTRRGPGGARGLSHTPSRTKSIYKRSHEPHNASNKISSFAKSSVGTSSAYFEWSVEQSLSEIKIKDGYAFKGIVAARPAEPRPAVASRHRRLLARRLHIFSSRMSHCRCWLPSTGSGWSSSWRLRHLRWRPPSYGRIILLCSSASSAQGSFLFLLSIYMVYSIFILKKKIPYHHKPAPWNMRKAYSVIGTNRFCYNWQKQKRWIMCRAKDHQFYSRMPTFDALGVQLFAIIHEHI